MNWLVEPRGRIRYIVREEVPSGIWLLTGVDHDSPQILDTCTAIDLAPYHGSTGSEQDVLLLDLLPRQESFPE